MPVISIVRLRFIRFMWLSIIDVVWFIGLAYRRLNIIFTIIRDAATSVEVSFGYATLVYMPWRRGATREETRSRIAIWPRLL